MGEDVSERWPKYYVLDEDGIKALLEMAAANAIVLHRAGMSEYMHTVIDGVMRRVHDEVRDSRNGRLSYQPVLTDWGDDRLLY